MSQEQVNTPLPLHSVDIDEAIRLQDSTPQGLSSYEAGKRLARYGENRLTEGKKRTLLSIFFTQFADLMIWVLLAAAVISAFFGEWVDASIIGAVVLINAILGTVQESKAEAALEALKNMAAPSAKALRDGDVVRLPAVELVPGDVVLLEAGDSIPADLRLIECASIKAEESALTGESVPVEKDCRSPVPEDAALGDRINMAYMGTAVTFGRGLGLVAATGMQTQMGSIAGQLAETKKESTPLQQKLAQISKVLSIGVLVIAAVIFVIGLAAGGREPVEMFLTAVSLAVAAIPEGMVAVVTIVLAMGMSRMAGKGAIIRRLPAVETLGSTQVICSDKTGTLTQNKMTVVETATEVPALLRQAMGHCNDAKPGAEGTLIGDPTETALLSFILEDGSWTTEQLLSRERRGEIPFDSDRKLSTVGIANPSGKGYRIFVKGAPDVLLSRCVGERRADGLPVQLDEARLAELSAINEGMAKRALRVLAFACKDVDDPQDFSDIMAVESGLDFVGMTGMIDPARPEAREAIAECRKAGVLPVMITGDHKITASAIAEDLGILSDGRRAVTGAELETMTDEELFDNVGEIGVYARVAPEHKSRIVAAWQRHGKIVAMTGDGVNDAPALKGSDIGVGMGITGTDVAKGAADMVLTDDNFATIVVAIKEGRRIFDNIHKAVRFLLSSNMGEVIAILISTIAGWNLLSAVHILWINLVTDTFPALALGAEPTEPDVMSRPPRDAKRPFLTRGNWGHILLTGAFEAGLTLLAYHLGGKGLTGTSMAFLTLSMTQLFAAVGFYSERHSILAIKPREHMMLWLAFGASTVLQLLVFLVPGIRELFGLAMLSGGQWLTVLVLCFVMLGAIEVIKLLQRLLGKDPS